MTELARRWGGMSFLSRIVREPLLHFAIIGAGLFFLYGWKNDSALVSVGANDPRAAQIVVSRSDIDRLVDTYARTWQRPPTKDEIEALVENLVRDEIYYREALAIGLDRDDGVIKRRMRQKMEFILEDIAAQVDPADEDLLAFLRDHPERYLLDAQIGFLQVFVSDHERGANAEADARTILSRLRAGEDPAAFGDPIPLEAEVRPTPLWDIENRFGKKFADSLSELKPGRWEGPVRSGFGLHLVFISERLEERMPELKEVRDAVKRDWAVSRQKEMKEAAYARLRDRYTVVVEISSPADSLASADETSKMVRR